MSMALFAQKGAWFVYGFGQNVGNPTWHTNMASKLHTAGVGWAAVPIFHWNGNATVKGGVLVARPHDLPTVFKPYTDRGIQMVAWGDVGPDASDAGLLVGQVMGSRTAFAGVIVDAEFDYEDPHRGRSEEFLRAFDRGMRGRRRWMPKALSHVIASPPWNKAAVMDYGAWDRRHWRFLPQAYQNKFSWMTPQWAVQHDLEAGIAVEHIHPTIGVYDWDGPKGNVVMYESGLRSMPATGWSIFVADGGPYGTSGDLTTDDWLTLGRIPA